MFAESAYNLWNPLTFAEFETTSYTRSLRSPHKINMALKFMLQLYVRGIRGIFVSVSHLLSQNAFGTESLG